MKSPLLVAPLALLLAGAAQAAPVITVGAVTLAPNTAGQVVNVFVTGDAGGTQVQGLNLRASTGAGGVTVGGTLAPSITSSNLKPAGGVFAGISDAQTNSNAGTQGAFSSIAYLSGGSGATLTVPATRTLLATITVSTVGFTNGTYDLRLANVFPNSGSTYTTNFAGLAANITNGTITVAAPEPAGLAAVAFAGAALLRRGRRAPTL